MIKNYAIKPGILWIAVVLLAVNLHKFYVSVTEIHYNPQNQRLEIILHTFPDDLLLALKKNYRQNPDLDQNPGISKKLINLYLHRNFALSDGQNPVPYRFLGYTFEDDRIVLLMEAKAPENFKHLKVRQTWLLDVYPSQQNIVHLIMPNNKQTFLLDASKTEADFEIR